jgi:hypothetical protein
MRLLPLLSAFNTSFKSLDSHIRRRVRTGTRVCFVPMGDGLQRVYCRAARAGDRPASTNTSAELTCPNRIIRERDVLMTTTGPKSLLR